MSYIFVQTCFKRTQSVTGNSNIFQTIPVINNYNQKRASLDQTLPISSITWDYALYKFLYLRWKIN